MYNLLCCCKALSCNKNKPYGFYNRFQLLEKGLDKFSSEFDAEQYAKSIRNLKMLVSSVMDENERSLGKFQHTNTISLIKSESDEESEGEIDKEMPKLIERKSTLAHHRNIVDKFLLKYYTEKHTSKDYKLMNGIMTKKTLTNEDIKKMDPTLLNSNESQLQISDVNLFLDQYNSNKSST